MQYPHHRGIDALVASAAPLRRGRRVLGSGLWRNASVAQLLKSKPPCDLADEPSEARDSELRMVVDEPLSDGDRVATVRIRREQGDGSARR